MAKTGTRVNSLKQQRQNGELELIIEEFGNAMRCANMEYVAEGRMTLRQYEAGQKYVEFARKYYGKKA